MPGPIIRSMVCFGEKEDNREVGVCLTAVLMATLDPRLAPILTRVSEEAQVFAQKGPRFLGVERMKQKGRAAPPRFKVRFGADPSQAPEAGFKTTEIVSEYAFGALKAAPNEMRELRRVVSVNGKPVREKLRARLELAEGMASDADRLNRQMLQDLEAFGLVGAATDLGQMLLMFQRSGLGQLEFDVRRLNDRLGAEPVTVLGYRQVGDRQARVYHGRQLSRVSLTGELWVRQSDFTPLRITADLPVTEGKNAVLHQMSVDYAPGPHGVVLPARSSYMRRQNTMLLVETIAEYSDFKMFSADADIKFLAEGEEPEK